MSTSATKLVFKIWSVDHRIKKGVVASSWKELQTKVHVILGYPEDRPLTFVLNSDGTEVDEEYAEAVEMHSVLIALKDGDRWTEPKKGNEDSSNKRKVDAVCGAMDAGDQTDAAATAGRPVRQLLHLMIKDPTIVISLSAPELQSFVDADIDQIHNFQSEEERRKIRDLQNDCQHHLDQRFEYMDAMQTINYVKEQLQYQETREEGATVSDP